MAKTIASRIDFRSIEIPSAAQKPLYAGVGAGDLAVTAVLEYVSDVQRKLTGLQKSVSGIDPKKVRDSATDQAKARRDAVEKRVADLQAEALSLPTKVQTRVQGVVDDNVAAVTSTYEGLAERGKAVVNGTKLPTTATVEVKVNTTVPAARKGAKKTPATRTAAKKTSTTAKKASTTAKKSASTAKKTAAKKTSAAASTASSTAASAAKKTEPSA